MKKRLILLTIGVAVLPCAAQIVNTTGTIVDPCGGQPTYVNSTTIIEDSWLKGSSLPCTQNLSTHSKHYFDLKTCAYSAMSSSWTCSALTNSTTRTLAGLNWQGTNAQDASIGNPFVDQVNPTHLVFLMQDCFRDCLNGSQANAQPKTGTYYDVVVCNSITSITSSNCSIALTINTSATNVGATIDLVIVGTEVLVEERQNAAFRTTYSVTWPFWTVDDISVTWNTPGTAPTIGTTTRYWPGGNSLFQRDSCEQSYKITSALTLPNGTIRVFLNANQQSNSYAGVKPVTNCNTDGLGGGTATGALPPFYFWGTFYFDLSSAPTGANFTQLSSPTAPCVTPAGNISCWQRQRA